MEDTAALAVARTLACLFFAGLLLSLGTVGGALLLGFIGLFCIGGLVETIGGAEDVDRAVDRSAAEDRARRPSRAIRPRRALRDGVPASARDAAGDGVGGGAVRPE